QCVAQAVLGYILPKEQAGFLKIIVQVIAVCIEVKECFVRVLPLRKKLLLTLIQSIETYKRHLFIGRHKFGLSGMALHKITINTSCSGQFLLNQGVVETPVKLG